MKLILITWTLALSINALAVEGEAYTNKIGSEISKIEAMKQLLTTDNKAQVYKCVLVELSKKGTVKNK